MAEGRSAIPEPLRRRVLVEAGHRCAIPRCRLYPVELHHIRPWAENQEHTFENLIALCPNCHALVTSGAIDRKSVEAYKANLGVLNGRYGEFERRVLGIFTQHPEYNGIELPGGLELLLWYLLQDGILAKGAPAPNAAVVSDTWSSGLIYTLTETGAELVRQIRTAELIG